MPCVEQLKPLCYTRDEPPYEERMAIVKPFSTVNGTFFADSETGFQITLLETVSLRYCDGSEYFIKIPDPKDFESLGPLYQFILQDLTLFVTIQYECSETIPIGGFIAQSLAAGTMVSIGSEISLIFSSGSCNLESELIAPLILDPCFTEQQVNVINAARNKWNTILPCGLSPVDYNGNPQFDQIEITVVCEDFVPGPDGFVPTATGGPLILRPDGLPLTGGVNYNTDFLGTESTGFLFQVMCHEIAHALGFGTLWANAGLVSNTMTPQWCFNGPAATAEYNALNPGPAVTCVPLEDSCPNAGSNGSHWSGTCANDPSEGLWLDVMSASAGADISRVTIATFLDLGYPCVDLSQGDGFVWGG